jgi:phospholipase/carboxylesterase
MADLLLTHIYRPPLEPTDGPPPLLVLLHGVGSNEADLFGMASELDPRFAVVSARAPHTRFEGSYAWFEVQVAGGEFVIETAMETRSRDLLTRFIPEATETYGADPGRVYLTGFSQGAIMSLGIMLTRPELLAGVVAMSGRLLPELRPIAGPAEDLAGFPVMVVHGSHDAVIPARYADEVRAYLEQLPVDLTFEVFPMGHEVSGLSLRAVDGWLRAQLEAPAR